MDGLLREQAVCFFGEACFAAGTPLAALGGAKRIEHFVVDDMVLSRNEFDPDGPCEYKRVEAVFRRLAVIFHVTAGGRLIRTTGEHPFHVYDGGWTPAHGLRVGDRLTCADGTTVAVEEVVDTGEWEVVYNLRVADHHTYFVGTPEWGFAVWAHNRYSFDSEHNHCNSQVFNKKSTRLYGQPPYLKDAFIKASFAVPGEQGWWDLFVHGELQSGGWPGVKVGTEGRWEKLALRTVMNALVDTGWRGQPIRYVACEGGAGLEPFAQKLANAMKIILKSPDIPVFINFNGTMEVEELGGKWDVFRPAGT